MDRAAINRLSGRLPLLMSAAAFGIVLCVVLSGWQRGLKDEGAAAHLFQLLVIAEAPLIALFLATADWSHGRRVARALSMQGAALVIALGSVAVFRL